MDGSISVLLADDHPLVLEGLRYRLEAQPGIDLVGVASSGQELLTLAQALQPDVVVTDITMPGLSGLEACRILRETCPAIRVLVLTMHDNEEYIRRAVACGAAGYVLKDASAEHMVFALREVASGRSHFGSSVSRALLEEKEGRLTQRETDVLKLMFEGMSSRDIGEALAISARTVESHRSNIYRKLNTNSMARLFRYAMRHGLVELE
ncbi:response regulator transcription factor [Halomonas campisalis]|uniref:Response regulator transcription factor n=1 Tax=Billgrantia campisalis TaxID=74661 RepID=A0ABS9P8Q5_9GAMM|nr:response regulator transcription factor [Halomonas campisalis]MCG6658016.1 response regulator transcription factor [Halomonas campisalis]MDR5864850.1 response regulator transcription factor [Halomonas campisalis]